MISTSMRRIGTPYLLGLCLVVHPPAAAAESTGITVTGTGTINAPPDVVELSGFVRGDAELADDAITKFRGNKRRVLEAIEGLGIEGLSVSGEGFTLNTGEQNQQAMQRMVMGGGAQPQMPTQLGVSERLTVTLTGIDRMEDQEVLDTIISVVNAGRDVGLALGPAAMSMIEMQLSSNVPASLATFKLSNVDELRRQAYEEAMADARANAERLAELAGVQLGPVDAIRVGPEPTDDESNVRSAYVAMMMGVMGETGREPSSPVFKKIPVAVTLVVRFQIAE